MKNLIGCLLLPYLPELVTNVNQEENKTAKQLAQAVEQAVKIVQNDLPQTLVLLAPNSLSIETNIAMVAQPRLKGTMTTFGLPETVVAFETDSLLMKLLHKQCTRLGIDLQDISDLAGSGTMSAPFNDKALIPLYYLMKAGFKGQIVNLTYGTLPYEEMYTFGKALQLAINTVSKKVLVVAAAALAPAHTAQKEMAAAYDLRLVEALKNLSVKDLLGVDPNLLAKSGEGDLRALFFLLGTLGGVTPIQSSIYYEVIAGTGYTVGEFIHA